MDSETETIPALTAPAPGERAISAALAEHDAATDRVAVIIKYPWLVSILNDRQNQTK